MKRLFNLFLISLTIVGMVSCGSKNSGDSNDSSKSDENANDFRIPTAGSLVMGDDSEYISITDQGARLGIGESVIDGQEGYTILMKVPVKVNRSVKVSSMNSPELMLLDEMGAPANDKFYLGYGFQLSQKQMAEEELKNLLKQPAGTTGELTFFMRIFFHEKRDAERFLHTEFDKVKGIRITGLRFYSKEDITPQAEAEKPREPEETDIANETDITEESSTTLNDSILNEEPEPMTTMDVKQAKDLNAAPAPVASSQPREKTASSSGLATGHHVMEGEFTFQGAEYGFTVEFDYNAATGTASNVTYQAAGYGGKSKLSSMTVGDNGRDITIKGTASGTKTEINASASPGSNIYSGYMVRGNNRGPCKMILD